ncbi:MAG: UDP-N-acetylmuramoyl-L-alanine--D-glutamate ligase [Olsenella sp.]|nr:UDP-N-acetylmuramoyl-L-alanine--D-glutamate ligase [Olsenella sp.]
MKHGQSFLGNVCVLGLGKTGVEVAHYLLGLQPDRVSSVTLFAGSTTDESEVTRELTKLGVRVVLGCEEVSGDFDLAIASPGISEFSRFFLSARDCSREIVGEPEFAWRESPERWVAITGSNGKTTTTSLATALLREGGMSAAAVGNIGNLCTTEVARRRPDEWFVAELSSFQLATTSLMHPRVACLLNVTPDHLEWHGSLEKYALAKEKVFNNLDAGDLAVVSAEDEFCLAAAARLEERGLRVLYVGVHVQPSHELVAYVRDGRLVVCLGGNEHVLVRTDELSIKGDHNIENALFASAVAVELGVPDEAIGRGLVSFKPLEHRIEPVATVRGVGFVNDSKATNTDSTEKALAAFPPGHIVILLGGHDKGTDLTSLASVVMRTCKAAVCFGEAGERIARALEAKGGDACVLRAPHLREAFACAVEEADEGDTVLLSPACSSFDEFQNMAERGRLFKQLVAALEDERGGSGHRG